MIGKKWIYLERNALHRQSVGSLRRQDQHALSSHVVFSSPLLPFGVSTALTEMSISREPSPFVHKSGVASSSTPLTFQRLLGSFPNNGRGSCPSLTNCQMVSQFTEKCYFFLVGQCPLLSWQLSHATWWCSEVQNH